MSESSSFGSDNLSAACVLGSFIEKVYADRDFSRIPGLRVRNPLIDGPRAGR
jgi:hypothetical protein